MLHLTKNNYLIPIYDTRKSFYDKALIIQQDEFIILKSYDTNVLIIDLKLKQVYLFDAFSNTTLRHIKEVLKQLGFKCESKKQIEQDYKVPLNEFIYYLTNILNKMFKC